MVSPSCSQARWGSEVTKERSTRPALGPVSPPLTTARGWLLTGAPSTTQGPCHPGALDSGAVVGGPGLGPSGGSLPEWVPPPGLGRRRGPAGVG